MPGVSLFAKQSSTTFSSKTPKNASGRSTGARARTGPAAERGEEVQVGSGKIDSSLMPAPVRPEQTEPARPRAPPENKPKAIERANSAPTWKGGMFGWLKKKDSKHTASDEDQGG